MHVTCLVAVFISPLVYVALINWTSSCLITLPHTSEHSCMQADWVWSFCHFLCYFAVSALCVVIHLQILAVAFYVFGIVLKSHLSSVANWSGSDQCLGAAESSWASPQSQAREQALLCKPCSAGLLCWSMGIFQQLKLAHHRPLSLGVYLSAKFDSILLPVHIDLSLLKKIMD